MALIKERKVSFHGQMFNVDSALQMPWTPACPIVDLRPGTAHAPDRRRDRRWHRDRAGGPEHAEDVRRAAYSARREAGGRPALEISVGLPLAVCDDHGGARAQLARMFEPYAKMPNYRRVLEMEGGETEEVAVFGSEAEVERKLQAIAAAGATEFSAAIFPVGDNARLRNNVRESS